MLSVTTLVSSLPEFNCFLFRFFLRVDFLSSARPILTILCDLLIVQLSFPSFTNAGLFEAFLLPLIDR